MSDPGVLHAGIDVGSTTVKVAVLDPRTGLVLGESAEIEVKLGI